MRALDLRASGTLPVTNGGTEIAFPSSATFYGAEGFLALLCDPAAEQLWLRLLLFHSHKAAFLTIPMGFKLLQQVCQLSCVSQGCLGGPGGGGKQPSCFPCYCWRVWMDWSRQCSWSWFWHKQEALTAQTSLAERLDLLRRAEIQALFQFP